MKKFCLFLSVLLLCFCAVCGSLFCLITAFQIPVEHTRLTVLLAAASLLCACSVFLRRIWILYLCCFLALSGITVYAFAQISEALAAAVYCVTEEYAKAFDNISAIRLNAYSEAAQATAFFAILGACLCILVCAYLQTSGLQWGAVIMTAPFLIASLIILQTEPAVWCQVLVIGSYAVLLLTASLRNCAPERSATAVLLLCVPVAAVMLALVLLTGPKDYNRSDWSESLKEKVGSAADRFQLFQVDRKTGEIRIVSPLTTGALGSRIWNRNTERFNLSSIGPQRQLDLHVMDVWCEETGTMYLRGSSMAVYEDNRWSALPEKYYSALQVFPQAQYAAVSAPKTVRIRTDRRAWIYYTPYDPTVLPQEAQITTDAYVKNPLQQTEYSITCADTILQDGQYKRFVYWHYLQVPEKTVQAIEALHLPILEDGAAHINDDPNVYQDETATRVFLTADYVRNSAVYDLSTPRMPEGEDFTAWFLSESDTGYCVHYATATVILLRMQGIPARFVTGYLVDTQKNQWSAVTEADAHAWVEYFSAEGWKVLDPTPSSDQAQAQVSEYPRHSNPNNAQNQSKTSDNTNIPKENETDSEETEKPIQGETQRKETGKTAANATKVKNQRIIPWLLLAAAVLIALRNVVIRASRKQRLGTGTLRKRIIETYHEIEMIQDLRNAPIAPEILSIAQEARFSAHPANTQQLDTMLTYYRMQRAKLMQTTLAKKFRYVVWKAL